MNVSKACATFRHRSGSAAFQGTGSGGAHPALRERLGDLGALHSRAMRSPFVPNPPGVKWMDDVPLSNEDRAKILSGNAKRLLRL
jgi:hypothetical protein